MKLENSWALALRNLYRHPLRSFLMMLGVIVAIAALTVVSTIGEGTRNEVLTRMERFFGPNNLLLAAGGGRRTSAGIPGNSGGNLSLEDAEAIGEGIDNIDLWDPYQVASGITVTWEGVNTSVSVFGYGKDSEQVWSRPTSSGRYFDAEELDSSARVALIGQHTARDLFGSLDPIGERIRLDSIPFEIIGVLDLIGPDPHGMDRDDELVIPITTLMRRILNVDSIRGAKFRLVDGDQGTQSAEQMQGILRVRHALGEGEPNDFQMITPAMARGFVNQASRTFTLFLPLLSGVALLVGALVVVNLQLMSVRERVAEIGLRMAIGARGRDISTLLLLETTTLTTLAGVLGIGLGLLIGKGVESHLGQAVQTPWLALALGLALSLAVGLLAGLLPARRAAAIQPALALRT